MDEKVFDFQLKIDSYEEQLCEKRAAYEALGDRLADLEVKVCKASMLFMGDNPEAKKMSVEKIERLAAITDEQKADYFELVGLRIREKIADKLMNSLHSSTSAVQSQMSWFKSTNIHGMK
jgi:hypothetical protein